MHAAIAWSVRWYFTNPGDAYRELHNRLSMQLRQGDSGNGELIG